MDEKKLTAPTNTTAVHAQKPLDTMSQIAVMGPSGIEAQESRGQRELVNSDVLPIDIQGNGKDLLEKMGFKFLGPVPGDNLFQYVEMPAGWKKAGTEHPMWSNLLDDKGRKRGSIFYKAAFYDRNAHMNLCLRYRTSIREENHDHFYVGLVLDGETVIHETQPFPFDTRRSPAYDGAYAAADAWLKEHFPNYTDVLAYWD